MYRAEREALYAATPWWHVRKRSEARRAARQHVRAHADELNASLAREYEFSVRTWPGLELNDPATVLEVLQHAFGDSATPAFTVACENDAAAIVVLLGNPDDLPDDTCVRDPDR
jgi:hypothetical protein